MQRCCRSDPSFIALLVMLLSRYRRVCLLLLQEFKRQVTFKEEYAPFACRNQNDSNDTVAIAEASRRPNIIAVPI